MIDTTHPFDPRCSVCQEARREGISHDEAMHRAQIRNAHYLEQVGWVVHVITDAPTAHTHGLEENYGHPDFQVWLPVSPRQRYQLLAALATAVKAGQRFGAGEEDTTVFSVPVRFVERTESGRRVLRAVFPDAQGRFPGEPGCAPGFAEQLSDGGHAPPD